MIRPIEPIRLDENNITVEAPEKEIRKLKAKINELILVVNKIIKNS